MGTGAVQVPAVKARPTVPSDRPLAGRASSFLRIHRPPAVAQDRRS